MLVASGRAIAGAPPAQEPRADLDRTEGGRVAAHRGELENGNPGERHEDGVPAAEVEPADGLVGQEDVRREPGPRVTAPEEDRDVRGRQTVGEVVPGAVRGQVVE